MRTCFCFPMGLGVPFPLGAFKPPPPSDPVDLAKGMVQFWEIATQQAEAEYRDQRVWMLSNPSLATEDDNESHLEALTTLRDNVIECRLRVAEAHAVLVEIDPREAGHLMSDEDREALAEADTQEALAQEAWRSLVLDIDANLPDSPE